MKTITSREAQNAFGSFLDSVQHEPVMVTRKNRPVGVMLSMNDLPAILTLANSLKETIKTGITTGLAESTSGKGDYLTDDYIQSLKIELQARIKNHNH